MQGIKNQKMRRAIDRRNLYLSVIDYFDGVINFKKISKKIYIPIDEVKTDLKLLGLFDENEQESPEYFEIRKRNYENYFKELGYKPYKSVVSECFGYSMKIVSEDFEKMGITNQELSRENYRVEIEKTAISRLDDYKKYYFETDKNRNMCEVAKKMGLSRPTVLRDITYLKELYGEQIDKVKCDVIAEKEKKAEELRNRQEIREKEKLEREKLNNYVIENYFTSLYYIRGEKLCENLGITKRELNNIRDYILRTNNTVFVRARYWNSVTLKYDNVPLDIKILSYKKYIENVKELHTISDLKEMALFLRLSIDEVFSDFKLEIVQNEVCVIDVSDNAIKSVVTRNYEVKREERFELYKEYFKENKIFTSYNEVAIALGIHRSTVSKDFKTFDLYNLFNLEKVNKRGYIKLSDEEILRRKERADLLKLERVKGYENYFNENGFVTSLRVLSQELGYNYRKVYEDFNEFALLYKYLVTFMSESRLAAYQRFFSENTSIKSLRELSNILHISYEVVRKDFKKYNLYSLYDLKCNFMFVTRKFISTEERLKAYNDYFEKNGSVESIKHLAKVLDFAYLTVLNDFRNSDLYSLYDIECKTVSFEKRLELYNNFFVDNKSLKSLKELAEILNLNYQLVLQDFRNEPSLYKYLDLIKFRNGKQMRFDLYNKFFEEHNVVNSIMQIAKELNLNIHTVRKDFEDETLKSEYLKRYAKPICEEKVVVKEPKISKREQRKEYYFANYFNLDKPKPPTIMAKELGVGYDIVRRDLRNLSKEYNVPLKEVSDFKGYRYEQRKSFYLNSEEMLSVSELAEKFGVSDTTIYNDLKRIYEELKQE